MILLFHAVYTLQGSCFNCNISENVLKKQFGCLKKAICPQHYNWNKLCIRHRPRNIYQLKTILFCHLNNATSLILVQFPPSEKLSGPFIWAEAERGTLSGNRCSGCLMLACGGPAGLKHEAIVTPFWRPTTHFPPSFLLDEAARCQKYMQLCWIKHLTHWLPDW